MFEKMRKNTGPKENMLDSSDSGDDVMNEAVEFFKKEKQKKLEDGGKKGKVAFHDLMVERPAMDHLDPMEELALRNE